jgi:hypothetical protein
VQHHDRFAAAFVEIMEANVVADVKKMAGKRIQCSIDGGGQSDALNTELPASGS